MQLDTIQSILSDQAVVLFMAGEHDDAMSRMDDLITVRFFDPTFYVVQEREQCAII